MVQSARLALPIANCAIGETVCYLAKMNKQKGKTTYRHINVAYLGYVNFKIAMGPTFT